MRNVFDEVEEELNRPMRKPSFLFRLVPVFIGVIFAVIIAYFTILIVSPETIARWEGSYYGHMVAAGVNQYEEDRR